MVDARSLDLIYTVMFLALQCHLQNTFRILTEHFQNTVANAFLSGIKAVFTNIKHAENLHVYQDRFESNIKLIYSSATGTDIIRLDHLNLC